MSLFRTSWMAGLALAIILYATQFDEMSETELVRWSYLWIPLIVFGVAGSISMKKRLASDSLQDPFKPALMTALKWTLLGIVLLLGFFETIWKDL